MRASLISLCLLALLLFPHAVRANPSAAPLDPSLGAAQEDCQPGLYWRWTRGPDAPELAGQAEARLAETGVQAEVQATGYGEVDHCGEYHNFGYDFNVTLRQEPLEALQAGPLFDPLANLVPTLEDLSGAHVGNVSIQRPDGRVEKQTGSMPEAAPLGNAAAPPLHILQPGSFYRNVYVILLDPQMKSGKTLVEHMRWNDYRVINQAIIDFFETSSSGQLQYRVVATSVDHGWPVKADGFVYSEEEYLGVMSGRRPPHMPDDVNYNKIVNTPEFDICGRVNRGEIDEVWIWGAPYFGFFESTLLGPNSFSYNGTPVARPWTCNRLVPIMGFSYERGVPEAMEDFGHRSEATMERTYGDWRQNRTRHNWDRFGLNNWQSPDYEISGCGSIHYPANAVHDYDWSNPRQDQTYCDDFLQYPNLPDPPRLQTMDCGIWDCDGLRFFHYWFSHIPNFPGCGPDQVSNQWWNYLTTPAMANDPLSACQKPAQLSVRAPQGRPGSVFTIQGTSFPANRDVQLLVNQVALAEPVRTDSFGNFVFLLQTGADAAPLIYEITSVMEGSAKAAITLDPSAEQVEAQGFAPVLALPEGTQHVTRSVRWARPVSDEQVYSFLNPGDEILLEAQPNDGYSLASVRFFWWDALHGQFVDIAGTHSAPFQAGFDARLLPYGRTRLYAQAADSSGSLSPLAGIWIERIDPAIVAAPSNLAARAASCTDLRVTWTDASSDETNFHVERSPNGYTEWSEIAVVDANTTRYDDRAVTSGASYWYRVRAYWAGDDRFSVYSSAGQVAFPTCSGVTLVARPANQNVFLSQLVTVQIEALSSGQPVDQANVYLNFNPALLRVRSLQPGARLPNVSEAQYDNAAGQITFRANTPGDPLTQTFTLLTVVFEPIGAAPGCPIGFSQQPGRQTAVLFGGQPVLNGAQGSAIHTSHGIYFPLIRVRR